ncbi:MAG: M28 family peptidase, partial [Gammaproteobacteria bacterium]|nr:M28 family peptidase [Gammaproteobacteria bacterium]
FPAYDAYGELEVKDKWVMMFRYLPEDITPEHRQYLVNYAELHYKAMLARDRGALGIILVSGPNAGVEEQLIRLSLDAALSGTSIAGVSITDRLAAGLLGAVGRSLPELQTKLDQGEALPGFPLPGVRIQANIDLIQEQDRGRNVLARLAADKEGHRPAVVVGAHVDHLGRGEGTDSLADGDDVGLVHNGADDNASGVAAMLEIAQYLADRKANGRLPLERDVLFAAWSGEELGLLGSSHFVHLNGERKPSTTEKALPFAAYLNLDMVGRLDENLYLQGVGSSSVWMGEIERRNVPVGLSIVTQLDSYLPTDATSFYLQGVPVLSAFTGVHRDYNTPRDTADRLNYPDGARVARLMGLIARSLALTAKEPDYISMEKPGATASRRNLRAYLGTIPEYGDSDTLGVRLNGVAKSGPADRAGLRRGDLIVEMAGRKIENVHDYTHALNGAKVGQPVPLVVQREGQRVQLTVVPGSRE